MEPVKGMSPDEIAIRLRNIIKELVGAKAMNDDEEDGEDIGWVFDRIQEYRNSTTSHRKLADGCDVKIAAELANLASAIPNRRVSELRAITSRLQDALRSKDQQVRYERNYIDYTFGSFADVESHMKGLGLGNHSSLLEQAYSLVQGLPTVPNPPIGSAENTIRAIAAVVKAHYGILEGRVEEVSTAGSIDALLLTLAEEKKQEQASSVEPETEFTNLDKQTPEIAQYVKEGDTW